MSVPIVFVRSLQDDMSQLDAVKMTGLDASGFYIDVVSCDDSTQCVCVQEKLMWPLGLCHNVNDVMVVRLRN